MSELLNLLEKLVQVPLPVSSASILKPEPKSSAVSNMVDSSIASQLHDLAKSKFVKRNWCNGANFNSGGDDSTCTKGADSVSPSDSLDPDSSYPPLVGLGGDCATFVPEETSRPVDKLSSYASILAKGHPRIAKRIISKVTVEVSGQQYYLVEDAEKSPFFLEKQVVEQKYADLLKQYKNKLGAIARF